MKISSIVPVIFILFQLQSSAQINGYVLDSVDNPVANALVSHTDDAYIYTKTKADGSFDLTGSATTKLTVAALYYETQKGVEPGPNGTTIIHLKTDRLLATDVFHISFDHLRPGETYTKDELKTDFPAGYGKGFYENNDPATDRASIDPTMDFNGDGRSLKVKYPAGKVKTAESGIDTRIPLSGAFNKNTFASSELFLSYWMRFSDNFDMDACGGKLPSLGGSDAYVRENEWKGRIMWGVGGSIRFYMELPHKYDGMDSDSVRFWGDKIFDGGNICANRFTPYLTNSQWHQIELHYKLEEDGQAGLFEGWIDGNKAHEIIDSEVFGLYRRPGENMDNLTINAILISSFLGGGTGWEQDEDVYAWFDEFRISTQRIGNEQTPPVSAPVTQTIELQQGWNMVSLYVNPENSHVVSIFPHAEAVKNADKFYNAAQPEFLNSLRSIEGGAGYLVFNSTDEILSVTGDKTVTASMPQQLATGWHLIGVPSDSTLPLSVYPDAEIIKDFDDFYHNGINTSTLHSLQPGKAYYIKQ